MEKEIPIGTRVLTLYYNGEDVYLMFSPSGELGRRGDYLFYHYGDDKIKVSKSIPYIVLDLIEDYNYKLISNGEKEIICAFTN